MAERGSSPWRHTYWGAGCQPHKLATVVFVPGVRISVDSRTVAAFVELGRVFQAHGYHVRPAVTGAYNCRKQTGGTVLSSHAYGTAVDINWDTNPYQSGPNRKLVTDIPMALIRDVYRIRTKGGVQVFRWGGDWDGRPETPHSNYDSMHFEIVATPVELQDGIAPAVAMDLNDPRTWPVLKLGAAGVDVITLQRLLHMADADGYFGKDTQKQVNLYQASRGLMVDGVVGRATWTLLIHGVGSLEVGAPLPHKGLSA